MFKEILTKAIIGKGKKSFDNKYEVDTIDIVNNVLGCWVINNKMEGTIIDDKVRINGSFDVNIWYSCDDNTKTNVVDKHIDYNELISIHMNSNTYLSNNEIILSEIKKPTVIDVKYNNNIINFEIEKEIGVDVVGETKVKIQTLDDKFDEFDTIEEDISEDELNDIIDKEINENYLD